MEKLPKQDAGKSGGGTTRENYNADEIAQQSSYQDSTEVAQQMREGGKPKPDSSEPNNDFDAGLSIKGRRRSDKK